MRVGEDCLIREKVKTMQQGRTLRFMAVFLSAFLATTTVVYANHLAIAKINYRIPGGTSVQFSFLHVVEPPDTPILPTQFKCTVVHTDTSTLFRLSASLKEIKIDADPIETNRVKVGSKFVVTGKVLSHIAFVSRRGTRFLTEVAHFTMTIKDIDIPEDAKDAFDLAFVYGQNGIGALLREAIPDLVNCDDTCTLQLAEEKTVEEGEGGIEAHTASGD